MKTCMNTPKGYFYSLLTVKFRYHVNPKKDFEEIDEVNFPNADFIQPVVVDGKLKFIVSTSRHLFPLKGITMSFQSCLQAYNFFLNQLFLNSSFEKSQCRI